MTEEFRKIIFRNVLRHPLRSALTALGIAVALFAFCLIRTFIGAWYSGVDASAKNRLVTRNAVSLIFYLPLSYQPAIASVPGVAKVGLGNWFGGIYRDEKYRFQQFAVDDSYLDVYPEFRISDEARSAWKSDRTGILIGRELAKTLQLNVGDTFRLKGTIFPGLWDFTVRGIFDGREGTPDTRLMFFHWDYLNERNRVEIGRQPDQAGFYVIQLESGADPAIVGKAIDDRFANSYAETHTETETAFVQGFVSMSSTIIQTLNVVSGVVLGIMLLVLTNTVLMSFRERFREYSVLKSLGFESRNLAVLILGESMVLAVAGLGVLGVFLLPVFVIPPQKLLGDLMNFFPVFRVSWLNVGICVVLAFFIALLSSAIPLLALRRMRIVDGLRRLG